METSKILDVLNIPYGEVDIQFNRNLMPLNTLAEISKVNSNELEMHIDDAVVYFCPFSIIKRIKARNSPVTEITTKEFYNKLCCEFITYVIADTRELIEVCLTGTVTGECSIEEKLKVMALLMNVTISMSDLYDYVSQNIQLPLEYEVNGNSITATGERPDRYQYPSSIRCKKKKYNNIIPFDFVKAVTSNSSNRNHSHWL